MDLKTLIGPVKILLTAIWKWILAHFAQIAYQLTHFLLGYSFTLTMAIKHPHHAILLSGLLLNAYGIPKEFWWDPKTEGASLAGGALDLALYDVGYLVAWLVLR
jgi:hypothetical protein